MANDPNFPIFAAGPIVVTASVARFGNTSYAIANIDVVTITERPAFIWIAAVIIGAGLFLVTKINALLALGLMAVALIAWRVLAGMEATLVLKTSSGDVQALTSTDVKKVYAVKAAIEAAMGRRSV